MHTDPKVSIITATFNRSNVLRHAIASVLRSTFDTWDMIVVGDACTDDTSDVVQSFGDPRIRFVNLETNWGEQSKPNNEGVARSRGELVAFLNHDDLWLPDHLERCVGILERERADMVFSLAEVVHPDGRKSINGASVSGLYDPFIEAPASTWLCRREFLAAVGGWPSARDIWISPSQSLLFRGWKLGKRMVLVPELTVVAVQSGSRVNSYVRADSTEHDLWANRIREPGFRERELSELALHSWSRQSDRRIINQLRRAVINLLKRTTLLLGFHPMTLKNVIRYRRRGGFIDHLRRVRGLAPMRRE